MIDVLCRWDAALLHTSSLVGEEGEFHDMLGNRPLKKALPQHFSALARTPVQPTWCLAYLACLCFQPGPWLALILCPYHTLCLSAL